MREEIIKILKENYFEEIPDLILSLINEKNAERDEMLNEAIELIQYFVDRVEIGTIRSHTTYGKFKDFLKKIEYKKLRK